jgi:hypothetical protein
MSEIVNSIEELRVVESGAATVKPVAIPIAEPNVPKVCLPADGRNMSDFASQIGKIMGPKKVWFVQGPQVVEVRKVQVTKKVRSNVFHPLAAPEIISAVEDYLLTGRDSKNGEGEPVFVRRSMGRETATALLASPQFKRALPRIDRILDVPIPYVQDGTLVFARTGYDERLNTFCPAQDLRITPLGLEESKRWLRELFQDFCFTNKNSATMAIARLLTPMCRALMGWEARPPVFVFEGNRPRAGKDYLAGCTSVLYEGRANEDAPLDSEAEETVKRITAALASGRRFMHFANCKGHIDNSAFEHASTAKVYSARKLGSNDAAADMVLPNEIEFSVSANTGFSFTEDFNLRCRKISSHYSEEDANSRKFGHPDLHGWILDHRQELLNAVAGLIQYWHQKGCPPGETPFTSFPEWAGVVGGILTTCGLGDPCVPQLDGTLTSDTLTTETKRLFEIAFQENPNQWISKHDLSQLVRSPDNDLFAWLDLDDKGGQTTFWTKLRQFSGRCLGGIYLQINKQDNRRPKFRFTREQPPAQQNMAAAVLGTNQEDKCQPCQPCQPLHPYSGREDQLSDVCPMRSTGIEVDEVAKVDISQAENAVSLSEEEPDVNLQRDEDGCPRPPVGLLEPASLLLSDFLPKLDMRTRLERVLDTMNQFAPSPGAPSTVWSCPLYPERWDL